jgi:hypothetical protein
MMRGADVCREERDRKLQDQEGRLETLRRETIAAEEERLAFLMETLEARLRRGTDEAKRRVATYVQTTFPRRDEVSLCPHFSETFRAKRDRCGPC